jgi:hypothetical protein
MSAPSRLVLLLPTASAILSQLLSPAVSPTLSSLTVHTCEVINVLASTYLFNPPTSGDLSEAGTAGGSRFRGLLENATKRNETLKLALSGEISTIIGDWSDNSGSSGQASAKSHTSSSAEPPAGNARTGVVTEILIRKAAGGASKGMLRSLEGLWAPLSGEGASSVHRAGDLETCRWQEIKGLDGIATGYQSARSSAAADEKSKEEGKVCSRLQEKHTEPMLTILFLGEGTCGFYFQSGSDRGSKSIASGSSDTLRS